MASIEDIIVASYNENPTEVRAAFNDIMRDKILAALETYGDDTDSDDEASDEDESDVEVDYEEIEDHLDTEESEDGNT